MKKLFLLFTIMFAAAGQVRADVEWTIWEGSQYFEFTNGSSINIGDYCKSIKVGDVLTFTITLGTESYHQKYLDVKSQTTGWSATVLFNWEGIDAGTTSFTQVVTEKMYEEIITNSGQLNVGGKDYTLTKVEVTRPINSTIKKSLVSLTANGSFDGSLLSNASAGDYLYVEFTLSSGKTSGVYQLMGNSVNSPSFTVYDKLMYPLTTEQLTAWTASGTWPWSSMTNIASADIYLVQSISSFKIGSIGYATFSADQEVTVPEGLTAYKATVSGENVSLTPFTDNVIPANKGAIIKGAQGSVVEFLASSTGSTEASDLIAVTAATDVTTLDSDYDYYVLYAGSTSSETDYALSELVGDLNDWGALATWDGVNYTITYNESSTASSMGKWLNKDWSDYDYLKINFSSNTLNSDITFSVNYYEHDANATQATLAQGELTVSIPLDETYKNLNGNFTFSSHATSGSLTFESAALVDSDGGEKVAEFRKTETGTLAANKAYLKIAKGSPAKLNIIFGEEEEQPSETDGIGSIENGKLNIETSAFNLAGQRVGNDYKGLVIINGKKVLRK